MGQGSELQGVQELLELFNGEVKDGLVLENFLGLGFLNGDALASLAATGVLVRGCADNRFS